MFFGHNSEPCGHFETILRHKLPIIHPKLPKPTSLGPKFKRSTWVFEAEISIQNQNIQFLIFWPELASLDLGIRLYGQVFMRNPTFQVPGHNSFIQTEFLLGQTYPIRCCCQKTHIFFNWFIRLIGHFLNRDPVLTAARGQLDAMKANWYGDRWNWVLQASINPPGPREAAQNLR